MSSYQYRKSHCGDMMIIRPSYLHNGISYTGKMSSLYWIRALRVLHLSLQSVIKVILHEWHDMSYHCQFYCFINSFFRLTTEKMIKLPITDPLWGESTGFPSQKVSNGKLDPLDSPHKGSVMRKTFPCHDIVMETEMGFAFIVLILRHSLVPPGH